MDQKNDSNNTSLSHTPIDLSNNTSLRSPPIDISNDTSLSYSSNGLSSYAFSNYSSIDQLNSAFLTHPSIDISDGSFLSYPIGLPNNTSLTYGLLDNISLSHSVIDTSLSYSPIGLSNNVSLNHTPIDLSVFQKVQTQELTSLSHPTQNTFKPKSKKCNECKKIRKLVNHICRQCYKAKTTILSGNKVIDDFIKSTLSNYDYNYRKANLEFVPYGRFKDVEFVAEGGFSKIYKATWIDGPVSSKWNENKQEFDRLGKMTVALKELNNSENIDLKELNELKIIYNYLSKYTFSNDRINRINRYFGITQNPINKNFMIVTKYYKSDMIIGLNDLHEANIIHQDYHSGNIFNSDEKANYSFETSVTTGDFGISKSAIGSDNDNEVYGIIPYVAPEVFQGQKYTKASDIYSFGMIMWELMTGRRPFWDKSHDADLIIEICDGLRPPIVTNAPEDYIELMQECWHSYQIKGQTLSTMIKSANIIKSFKSQSIIPEFDKRKFMIENNNEGKIVKKAKLREDKNDGYLSKGLGFDIHNYVNSNKPNSNNNYNTKGT
ncbi:kinase-like domain-containing protein [Rhizophagus clarus]|uniref:Kinase-like domain-containing protein n=1 Tax=Rhizophagus clarus TaxID=94130 RepID=A0A8H3QUD5_9GLOM|nr:kinase-like domain-containing protein [Rhizophagus clarus]